MSKLIAIVGYGPGTSTSLAQDLQRRVSQSHSSAGTGNVSPPALRRSALKARKPQVSWRTPTTPTRFEPQYKAFECKWARSTSCSGTPTADSTPAICSPPAQRRSRRVRRNRHRPSRRYRRGAPRSEEERKRRAPHFKRRVRTYIGRDGRSCGQARRHGPRHCERSQRQTRRFVRASTQRRRRLRRRGHGVRHY